MNNIYFYIYNSEGKEVSRVSKQMPSVPVIKTVLAYQGLQAEVRKVYLDLDQENSVYVVKATII